MVNSPTVNCQLDNISLSETNVEQDQLNDRIYRCVYYTITTVSLRVFAHVSDSNRTVKSLCETVTVSEVGDLTSEVCLPVRHSWARLYEVCFAARIPRKFVPKNFPINSESNI